MHDLDEVSPPLDGPEHDTILLLCCGPHPFSFPLDQRREDHLVETSNLRLCSKEDVAHSQHLLSPHHVAQPQRDLSAQLHPSLILDCVRVAGCGPAGTGIELADEDVPDDFLIDCAALPQEISPEGWRGLILALLMEALIACSDD